MKIQFNLNGKFVNTETEAFTPLSELLRSLGCLSLKHGCRTGDCGACSILLDGKLVSSCILMAPQADGKSILTNEGLSESQDLHPIQQAFLESGAIQCGYCSSGMILATKALLDKETNPSLEEAREYIGAVLCRCTGYKKPVEAVLRAAAYMRREDYPEPKPQDDEKPTEQYYFEPEGTAPSKRKKSFTHQEKKLNIVGTPAIKTDGYALAKGKPVFTDDIELPGMLHAALLMSPHAHARIRDIDVSEALNLPGVKAVLTYKDIDRIVYASGGQSWPNPKPWDQVSLDNKVRYVGDRVAFVAAESMDISRKAVELIKVDYEILPAVFDPVEAMKDGAPVIHDETDAVDIKDAKHNIVTTLFAEVGDVEKGFETADHKFDKTYTVPQVQQSSIEGHNCITWFDENNRLIVRTSTQVPFHVRRMLSPLIGIPVSRIRVIKPRIGGGFGNKQEMVMEDICAHLTIATGRPVRMEYTREMEMMATRSRHPAIINFKAGVSKDGFLQSLDMKVIEDSGAYGTQGMTVCNVIGTRGLATYRCPNERFYADIVYTNKPAPGAYRGYGGPQGLFALESLMDEIAVELNFDLIEFRAKNVNRLGDEIPIMSKMGEAGPVPQGIESWGLPECVDRAATAIDFKRHKDPSWKNDPNRPNIRRGLGISFLMHGTSIPGLDMGGSYIKLNDDGSINIMYGGTDLGTGADTVIGQIAAETIGLTMDKVNVYAADTDITPFDVGAYASSTTFISGNAVRKTAEKVRDMIYDRAAILLECSREELTSHDNEIFAKDGRSISIEKVALHSLHTHDQHQIMATASHIAHTAPPSFGAQFAEVEVDIETGQVTVKKLTLCVDSGQIMNPMTALGQMEGGQTQALGYAVSEDMTYDENGRLEETRFGDYHIFQAEEMPEIQSMVISNHEKAGPYGAKGLGEIPIDGVGQAVANAVFNATGVRIRDLPILPEKVWEALQQA